MNMKLTQTMTLVFLFGFSNISFALSENPPIKPADSREVIWVSAEEKAALLGEMRNFLIASQAILESSLVDDMETVEAASRKVGIKLLKATPEEIHKKLPAGFTAIGPKTHMGFEVIADEASGLGDREEILNTLANLQKTCIACHAAYRFEVK